MTSNPSKYVEERVSDFEKKWPQFMGVGASFPLFRETPNYRHIVQRLRTEIEAALKEGAAREREEILAGIERLKITAERPDLEGIADIYRGFWRDIKDKITDSITSRSKV